MKEKKMNFFKKIKNAIVNFDEYKNFAEEKLWTTIKYIFKLAFIFSLIVSIAITYKGTKIIEEATQIYSNEVPEFRFENNILVIDSENKQFAKGDPNGYIGILMNSEKENLSEISEASNYQMLLAILKDKIVIKNAEGVENSMTYQQLSSTYDINKINKEEIVNVITSNEMTQVYTTAIVMSLIYLYLAYLIQILFDILLLSVVGYLLSKIIGVKFKYKSIFNMSAHAITLSILLYMIYIVVNLLTGFTIKYFEIAYNAIAYIYIITAMLMIKSDLIKQQIEVGKIVEEQKKVREEKQMESDRKREEKKKKDDKKKKENKEDENGEPEVSKA